MSLESPAVTSDSVQGETYQEFQARVARDSKRVEKKISLLGEHVAYCDACGETVGPEWAGKPCKVNNVIMASKWARRRAEIEFYRLGNFARGGWQREAMNLACLLDQVWAEGKASS